MMKGWDNIYQKENGMKLFGMVWICTKEAICCDSKGVD